MRRFLVVGCGGSGAVTLAYMMDQLRSDLRRAGYDEIPPGWQFISFDVPTAPGRHPVGLRSVRDQGGQYYGTAPQGEKYAVLDNALSRQLTQNRKLGAIASWAPRNPHAVPVPVTTGAGQYRAVGRMITLNQSAAILQRLRGCWETLQHTSTLASMRRLTLPGGGAFDEKHAPLVLVVSSMAGGAGASMALDVCRLLTMISGLDPRTIGVFMVTADVFDSLGDAATTGVRPNALAMLGEIIASQLGAATEHDSELMSGLGEQRGDGATVPFARVFPVSRSMGPQAAVFGDGTPEAVYRGLARGLAGMMLSGQATSQFLEYDLTNANGVAGERDHVGWGAPWNDLPWGTYGFSSLSMGRERYEEYAAQRLARSCVDSLLDGHLRVDSRASDEQQIEAALDSQWATMLSRLRLGGHRLGPKDVLGWLTTIVLPPPDADRIVNHIIDTVLRPVIPTADGVNAKQWSPDVRRSIANQREAMREAAERAAHIHAFEWCRGITYEIEGQVKQAISTFGLPYATAVVARLSSHFADNLRPGTEDLAKHAPRDIAATPNRVEQTLSRLKGVIKFGGPIVDSILEDYRDPIEQQVYASLSAKLNELTTGIVSDVLNPLREALNEPHTQLRSSRDKPAVDVGLALLATDQYGAWPSDRVPVPRRFAEANNEVMLTPSSDFPDQYDRDLPLAIDEDSATPPTLHDARRLASRTVVTGIWSTRDGSTAPGVRTPLIERIADWQPKAFILHPATGEQFPPPSAARYRVHLRADELLERARAYVGRTGGSFERFINVSLREFVSDRREKESVLEARRVVVVDRFADALKLARPLASVNSEALAVLHPGERAEYRYKFSLIPFADMPLGHHLRKTIADDDDIDQTAQTTLDAALSDDDRVTRIDIFGSYPNFSPLVYGAVLDPASRQWDRASTAQQGDYWKWRRARALPAALPMADVERHTMTAGWFLGLILGKVRIPPADNDEPVRVWDDEQLRWLDFPHPMLTPPQRLVGPNDWLPAVLESVLLAMAHSHHRPVMASLRPYRALRRIYDSSPNDPAGGLRSRSAMDSVVGWLRTGETRTGWPPVEGLEPGNTVAERGTAAVEWLTRVREFCDREFLPPGGQGPAGGGRYCTIVSREQASRTPLFRDLAPDVHAVTKELIELVEHCVPMAEQPEPKQTVPPVLEPDNRFDIPDGGMF
ncbi:tubulin-like doman-containing protein [Rhodococcus koreensis]